jgi:hypothetical protein
MMQGQITQVTKHGAAAGEAGRPERTDWTIDQGWEKYTTEDAVRASDEAATGLRVPGVRAGNARPADRR